MAHRVSTRDVIAFRLGAHCLAERLGDDGLLDAAGRCGIQNSPPGSALLALHARVRGVTPERLSTAAVEEKSLLQSWSLRGSPYYFPTADAPVFTAGVLPPTEEAGRHFVLGVGPALDRLDLSLARAVELTGDAIREVLAGRRLAIDELGAEIAGRIAGALPAPQRDTWAEEGPYAPGQPLGEAVVHFCLRLLSLRGVLCFGPRAGNRAPFVLVDEWLDQPVPDVDPAAARAELLRRYLRCYGPSTRGHFAAWTGIRAGDTEPWWGELEDELTEVDFGGRSWILTADLEALRSASLPTGVRLLPPHDPYTQLRDRETVLDPARHREVWQAAGTPGTVLADGAIAGTWRPRRSGRELAITVTAFGSLPARITRALHSEAEQVAALRGASSAHLELDPG